MGPPGRLKTSVENVLTLPDLSITLPLAWRVRFSPAFMFDWNRRRCHFYALLGYAAVAVVFTWPLVPNISTHLTGSPAGDTGVYVWNQWVFRHELLDNHRSPYFTDKIFSLSGRANLSLHNYTAFQDIRTRYGRAL